MRIRIVLGALLLTVGVGAALAAVAVHGPPWGYRGAPAVLIEVAGDVEVTGGPGRAAAGTLPAVPGMRLQRGDIVRVGRFSEARLRFENADVALQDGARAVLGAARLVLGRGTAEVVVPSGQRAAQIDVEGQDPAAPDATISVQPGRALLSCDGKGTCAVVVKEGSAQATSALGGESAEPNQALVLKRGEVPKLGPAPTKVEVSAECIKATKTVVGTAALGTQVYLNGRMDFADASGRFSLPWPPGADDAILFARDPAGNVDRKLVVCSP